MWLCHQLSIYAKSLLYFLRLLFFFFFVQIDGRQTKFAYRQNREGKLVKNKINIPVYKNNIQRRKEMCTATPAASVLLLTGRRNEKIEEKRKRSIRIHKYYPVGKTLTHSHTIHISFSNNFLFIVVYMNSFIEIQMRLFVSYQLSYTFHVLVSLFFFPLTLSLSHTFMCQVTARIQHTNGTRSNAFSMEIN